MNKVITRHRVAFFIAQGGNRATTLSFFRHQVSVAVPLKPPRWRLYIGQVLQAVPTAHGSAFEMKTLRYAYRVHKAEDVSKEALVRFGYVSEDEERDFRYCRHHIQFHRDYDGTRKDFSPAKLHIPTGWVTIEELIRS